MPPKKRVTFNPNVNIRHIPSQNRGRRVPPRGRPPPPPPTPPRPPRSRPLRRYSGMRDLTKIPKQKGGAFTREMAKKLFLKKLTRSSRPSVTKISKNKEESRSSKLKAEKRIN